MENSSSSFERLARHIESYVRTSIELAKLKLVAAVSRAATNFIAALSLVIPIILFTIIFNLGIAFWLGELLGKVYYGFFALAGFYLLLAIILKFTFKKWLRKSISTYIIKQLTK
ncbi:MAG: phage holin family protein [Saprospiraceae bacterium]